MVVDQFQISVKKESPVRIKLELFEKLWDSNFAKVFSSISGEISMLKVELSAVREENEFLRNIVANFTKNARHIVSRGGESASVPPAKARKIRGGSLYLVLLKLLSVWNNNRYGISV